MELAIVRGDAANLDAQAALALRLWPDNALESLKEECRELLASERDAVFLAKADGRFVGFLHVSLRVDYVEGSRSSPVGYVEGIYVEEAFRKRGVARALVAAGERWAMSRGAVQFASDAELDNEASQVFHRKLGFREAGRIVAFIKDLA